MRFTEDIRYMREALRLARNGEGWTLPNPMVGALVVKKGKVIGRGWHKKVGGPHAEIEAIRDARGSVRGATVYVTFEPCCHYGRTPPCTDALITAGVGRVVAAVRDPSVKVSGKGLCALRRAGIRVDVGALKDDARRLNEQFFVFHERRRPFVAVKFAASLDGVISTRQGDSKWITSREAREYARTLREQYQAILVGKGTVMQDDPHLGAQRTCPPKPWRRRKGARDPLRIILDSALESPLSRQVFRDNNVLVFTTPRASKQRQQQLEDRGIAVVVVPRITVPLVLRALHAREIVSVLVEGGGEVLGSFVDAQSVDRVYAFHAPILVGGVEAVHAIAGKGAKTIYDSLRLQDVHYKHFGDTIMTEGKIVYALH